MEKIYTAVIGILVAIALAWLLMAKQAAGDTPVAKPEEATTTAQIMTTLSPRELWLMRLERCESRMDPHAINPADTDGTPSYGILQFKPGTFDDFSEKYGITGKLMDPEAQRAIVRKMMDDSSVVWTQQFPDCVKHHVGMPPLDNP